MDDEYYELGMAAYAGNGCIECFSTTHLADNCPYNFHPFAPESDAPNTRCGDCNQSEGDRWHAGQSVDYRYWPKESDEPN